MDLKLSAKHRSNGIEILVCLFFFIFSFLITIKVGVLDNFVNISNTVYNNYSYSNPFVLQQSNFIPGKNISKK